MKPLCVAAILGLFASSAIAAPVTLQNATATFSQDSFNVDSTRDGNLGHPGRAVQPCDIAAAVRRAPSVLEALELTLRPPHVVDRAPKRNVRVRLHRGEVLLDPVVGCAGAGHLRQVSAESEANLDPAPQVL